MRKKIALFIIGFVLAVGAFLLYQYLTGASLLPERKPAPVAVAPADADRPPTFEERLPNGDLLYLLSTQKAVPMKDDQGHVLPGQYALTQPRATYYTRDGNVLFLRADRGAITVDEQGSGLSGKTAINPHGGHLSGNVRLLYGPRDSFTPDAPSRKPGQLEVRFDKDLDLNYGEQLLTSPGGVHVRSDKVEFDGENLTIAFNRQLKEIELLRIDPPVGGKNGYMLIRDMSSDTFGGPAAGTARPAVSPNTPPAAPLAQAPTTPETAPSLDATKPPATQPNPRTTYKVSFGNNVRASLAGRELTSEQLFLLFMSPVEPRDEKSSTTRSAAATPETPSPAPAPAAPATAPAVAAAPPGAGGVNPNDLEVRWQGPMEMRPAGAGDIKLQDKRDAVLEAVGTAARPVFLHDATSTLRAGRLWYHRAEDRLELEPGALGYVAASDQDPANPTWGMRKLSCHGITVQRTLNHVALKGPGQFEVPQALLGRHDKAAAPLVARWKKDLNIELASLPRTAKTSAGNDTKRVIRRATFTGGADITDVGFHLDSQLLDVLLASSAAPEGAKNSAIPGGAGEKLEHLLASGNVHIKVGRNGAGIADADKPDGINTDRLEIFTDTPEGEHAPVPSRLLATGNVQAWSWQPHRENGKETAKLDRDAIYTPTFDVALAPKPADTAAKSASDLNAGLANAGVKSLLAKDGVIVELAGNFGTQTVTASGRTLTVQMNGGRGNATALLEGETLPDGSINNAQLAQGDNKIGGARIQLDEKNRAISIPGKGLFSFVRPPEKPGDLPTPVQVTWDQKMDFNEKDKLARFFGNVDAHIVGRKDEASKLTCSRELDVQLGEGASTAGNSRNGLRSLRADGNVVAEGSRLDDQGKIISGLLLKTGLLTYDGSSKTLNAPGPGQMAIVDFSPDKTAIPATNPSVSGNNSKGETRFTWGGSLAYEQAGGLITFEKNVEMWHQPLKPFRMPSNLPGGGAAPAPKAGANPPIILTTDVLTAKLLQTKTPRANAFTDPRGAMNANPLALGASGDQKIERVLAEGHAKLTMAEDSLTAHTLAFDALRNIATAEAGANEPAEIFRPGQVMAQYEKIVWDLTKNQNAVTATGIIANVQQQQ